MTFDVRSEFSGIPEETRQALVEMQHSIRRAMDDQQRRIERPRRRVTEVVEEGSVFARPGEVVRVKPNDEDIQVVLPPSDRGNGGEDVIVSFEGDGSAVGKVLVAPASGTCESPGTTTLNTPGSYRFTSTGAPSEGALAEQTGWSGPAPLALEDLPPVATDTLVGNISGVAATPVEVPLASLDSTSIIYDPASHTFQRAALLGAIAGSQNGNATTFAGIRDNGSAENDRSNLNFVSSTSETLVVTDDAGNDELEITVQRAALTGAIAASANANATVFAGIRDNGAAESDRTNLNFLNSTSINLAVADDAGNDELEITAQRAALTGAVSAALNANTTLFAGIRDNGSSETARTNLNFVSTNDVVLLGTQDAGNDEIEISATLAPGSTQNEGTGGVVTLNAGTKVLGITSNITITGFARSGGNVEGDRFWLRCNSGIECTLDSSAAGTGANAMSLPYDEDTIIPGRGMVEFRYETSWRAVSTGNKGRLLRVTRYNSAGTGTHNFLSDCRRYEVLLRGANGAGGGANSAAAQCAVGGSGGRGAEALYEFTEVPTSIDYEVGAGGSGGSTSGTDGGNGGTTKWGTDVADEIDLSGGTGGTGSGTASFGSGSGTTTGFSRAGKGGTLAVLISGSLPSGATQLWLRSGDNGNDGVRISGTVGWGGGEVAGTGGTVSEDGQGALSLNNTDRGGANGRAGIITVWEYS